MHNNNSANGLSGYGIIGQASFMGWSFWVTPTRDLACQQQFTTLRDILFRFFEILAAFLPVKYAGENLLDTDKFIVLVFFVSLLVYFVLLVAETKLLNSDYHVLIANIGLLSGTFALVLLMLIIVPLVGWLIFFFWAFWFLKMARDLYPAFRRFIYYRNLHLFDMLKIMFMNRGLMERPNRLPV